jgi:hypothetical protein
VGDELELLLVLEGVLQGARVVHRDVLEEVDGPLDVAGRACGRREGERQEAQEGEEEEIAGGHGKMKMIFDSAVNSGIYSSSLRS